MDTSRRTAITALGTAGLTTAIGALAIGEYADDDRNRTGRGVAVADDDADADTDALADGLGAVRIAHLSPATPTVDVTVDGEQLVAGVAVDDRSPYLQFEPGTYTIRFTATDDPETILFEDEITVETAYYTIAVTDDLESDGVEPTVLVDAGAALVRVVHTASDAPPVDVTTRRGRLPLFEDVSFGMPTAYAPVPTGSYTLEAVATEASPDESTTDETDESDAADDSESSDSEDGADAAENDTAPAETDDSDETNEIDETPTNDSSGDETGDAETEDAGGDETGDAETEDAGGGADENESAAETDDDTPAETGRENASDAPAGVDEEDVPEDVDAEDVPDDIDADDIPDDIDEEDIPDDIDEEDIPDDIDEEDIPDDFSADALPDNSSRRVDGEPDVSFLSADRNQADSTASIDVTLERGRAYTGYVTDALESADRRGSDRDLSLTVTVDGEPGATELADESGESY
ncbi:DUF4397 domain-containing protein [Halomontanus rarus]|uniref:DUF4397 domain-containing protein n=1 Tax=Halomontanus rarus TaxID=3034020 RepID=UPI0023E87635|nr:DUF4397 domain-containing protein [Halovivax sp. TS33]